MRSSAIYWSGPSVLDGSPIMLVLSFNSRNEATGPMTQSWILRSDISPLEAVYSGEDVSICGDCIHRGNGNGKGRTCYVNLVFGPNQIYKSYVDGTITPIDDREASAYMRGRALRMGSYGDPAAVPIEVWERLLSFSTGHTGYTHQWRKDVAKPFKSLLMASCETLAERDEAMAMGWRTFRVKSSLDIIQSGEIVCPKSKPIEDSGHRQCFNCLACSGASHAGKVTVVIDAHGSPPIMGNYRRLRASIGA